MSHEEHKGRLNLIASLHSVHRRAQNWKTLKMTSLYQLALKAVPNPGLMAERFLVAHHPVARDLQAEQYKQDRDRYRENHRVLFRFVYADLYFMQVLNTKIYPSDVAYLNRLCKQIDDLQK